MRWVQYWQVLGVALGGYGGFAVREGGGEGFEDAAPLGDLGGHGELHAGWPGEDGGVVGETAEAEVLAGAEEGERYAGGRGCRRGRRRGGFAAGRGGRRATRRGAAEPVL